MKKVVFKIACLCLGFIMIAGVAIQRDQRIFGVALNEDRTEQTKNTKPEEWLDEKGVRVISTAEFGKEFIGYNANIPLQIYLKDNKIEKVEALENEETPSFFDRVVKQGLLDSWNGLTPEEALKKQVDVVSGATYSSDAIIKSVQKTMLYVADNPNYTSAKPNLDIKFFVVVVVILSGLILPFFIKSKLFRTIQLVLNVAVLGFWTCRFLSLSLLTGLVANKFEFWSVAITLLLLIAALIYPLWGKKDYYCLWLCPMGSFQELMGKIVPFKVKMSAQWVQILTWFRRILWFVLMLMLWLGIGFDLLNYEFFVAFMLVDAGWIVLTFAGVILLLSCIIPRPYCRFVCPTGTWVKIAVGEEFKIAKKKCQK